MPNFVSLRLYELLGHVASLLTYIPDILYYLGSVVHQFANWLLGCFPQAEGLCVVFGVTLVMIRLFVQVSLHYWTACRTRFKSDYERGLQYVAYLPHH